MMSLEKLLTTVRRSITLEIYFKFATADVFVALTVAVEDQNVINNVTVELSVKTISAAVS